MCGTKNKGILFIIRRWRLWRRRSHKNTLFNCSSTFVLQRFFSPLVRIGTLISCAINPLQRCFSRGDRQENLRGLMKNKLKSQLLQQLSPLIINSKNRANNSAKVKWRVWDKSVTNLLLLLCNKTMRIYGISIWNRHHLCFLHFLLVFISIFYSTTGITYRGVLRILMSLFRNDTSSFRLSLAFFHSSQSTPYFRCF